MTTTIAPISQMMLFMRTLSRNGIDPMPTVKVKVRSLASRTWLVGAAGSQIVSRKIARHRHLPSAYARAGLTGEALG